MGPGVATLALASARTWALLRVQASWSRALGPRWQWQSAALAVVLALIVSQRAPAPASLAQLSSSGPALIAALAVELLLGTVLGLLAALPGHALVGAARQSSAGLGLPLAGEPGEPERPTSLSLTLIMASLAAGLGLGLHGPLLASLLATFEALPLAAADAWLASAAELDASLVAAAAAQMSALALALATPVLLTDLVVSLALATLTRAGGSADALAEISRAGLRFGAALLALAAAWSSFPEAFARAM